MTSPVPISSNAHHKSVDGSRERESGVIPVDVVLDGRYRLGRLIGRGGMGDVCEARHILLGRRVVVKILRRDLAESRSIRKRFEREAIAVAQLHSEHIVPVLDFGLAPDGRPFFVMDHLEGTDFRGLLRSEGTLTAPRAVRLALDVCAGLAVAHAAAVVHRDLKPENLFVLRRSDGTELCKILDFGLAKMTSLDLSSMDTRRGVPLGTLNYMSPEQARGDRGIDHRTDIYAVGAILYEAMTGRRPHEAESAHALLYRIIHTRPRPLREICPFVPQDLAAVIHRALDANPDRRHASVQALRSELLPFSGRSPHIVSSDALTEPDVLESHSPSPTRGPDAHASDRRQRDRSETLTPALGSKFIAGGVLVVALIVAGLGIWRASDWPVSGGSRLRQAISTLPSQTLDSFEPTSQKTAHGDPRSPSRRPARAVEATNSDRGSTLGGASALEPTAAKIVRSSEDLRPTAKGPRAPRPVRDTKRHQSKRLDVVPKVRPFDRVNPYE